MHRLTLLSLLLLIVVLAGCGPAGNTGADGIAEGVQPGMRLPDAEFTTFADEKVRVHELQGRPVVINFWATWCGPCREEIPMLQQAYEATDRTGFHLLAVTNEVSTEVRAFMQENRMTFPVLFDRNGRAGLRYQVQGIPTTFFLNSEGVVVARHTGSLDADLIDYYLAQIMGRPAPTTPPPGPTGAPLPAPAPTTPPLPGGDTSG